MRRTQTINLVYISLAAAFLAVCSWISIPSIASLVPFTLQTFAVFVIVGLLGGKIGTLAILVYIMMAAVGVPVLSGFKGGLAALSGPTGGYVIGFLFTALIMSLFRPLIKKGHAVPLLVLSMILGLAVCYLFGTLWFCLVYISDSGQRPGFDAALTLCVLPYLIPDAIKIMLAATICSNRALKKTITQATAG
ncbi:MAG: biotin transporter BioY [Lachnospiraceae bacterium]|nr:biotin transporter BioY [Lachnospiraceae bacterium]